MDLASLPHIGKTLPSELWSSLCDAAIYSAATSGTRAWRDTTMAQGILAAGVDLAALEDGSGNRLVVQNFARELDLNTVGSNGWDGNSTISADMWVYLWLIAQDPDDDRIAAQWAFLASASSTAPTMPTGWTHKRLISAARIESDGGSGWQIAPFRHSGRLYQYSGRRLVVEYTAARTQTAQSLAAAVPPQVELAEVSLLSSVTSGSLTIEAYTTGASTPVWGAWAYSTKKGEAAGPIYCPSQSIDTAITMSGTASGSLIVTGFRWPEGAEP